MYDYIETLILRDLAQEELRFEALDDKLMHDNMANWQQKEQVIKVDIDIDDKHHEYHLIYH